MIVASSSALVKAGALEVTSDGGRTPLTKPPSVSKVLFNNLKGFEES